MADTVQTPQERRTQFLNFATVAETHSKDAKAKKACEDVASAWRAMAAGIKPDDSQAAFTAAAGL